MPSSRRLRPLVHVLLLGLLLAPAAPRRVHADQEDAPRVIARVRTAEAGFLHVTADALARLGVTDPARVAVHRRGEPVGVWPHESGLVFLAWAPAGLHGPEGTWELVLDGARAGAERTGPADGEAPTQGTALLRLDADRVHHPLPAARPAVYAAGRAAAADPWAEPRIPTHFLAALRPGGALVLDLDPARLDATGDLVLEAEVHATHAGPLALAARWGEVDLGRAMVATAAGGATMRWIVPASSVPPEGRSLTLRDVSPPPPPPPPQDVSDGRGDLAVDAITLQGVRALVADEALRAYRPPPSWSGPWQAAPHATSPEGVAWTAYVHGAGRVPWVGPAPADDGLRRLAGVRPPGEASRWVVSTTLRPATVEPVDDRPDPLAACTDAAHLILAVPALVAPARRLAAHRRSQGLGSVVVDVEDVYATYGHGEADARAIRAFLVDRMRRGRVPLAYVLLAGDATLDRTDVLDVPTIPAPMARTMYNGATAADRLYALPPDGSMAGGPALGRLPFRDAATLDAYVDQVVAYETQPPAEPHRRLLRFVTSEARFGPLIDRLIEGQFRSVLARRIPAAYDVEITFASADSPFLWPPRELNDKVVDAFEEGCLFLTYVGHGFAEGFDSLRIRGERHPIFHKEDAAQVVCRGTPPVAFVVACTTAIFDRPHADGVGEVLLARPRGPVGYWGATRICHPAANTLFGRALARSMAEGGPGRRLGDILREGIDETIAPTREDPGRRAIELGIRLLAAGADPQRLVLEGSWMYALLGDPALRVAFPQPDVAVAVTVAETETGRTIQVEASAPLPDGTTMMLSLEVPRSEDRHRPEPVADPLAPEAAEAIRRNHARLNDRALARATRDVEGGGVRWRVDLPSDSPTAGLVVKAWAVTGDDVHQGAAVLP